MINNKRPYAFFDVDGTIITINSLLSFLEYFFKRHFNDVRGKRFKKYKEQVKSYGENISRERLNEEYYKNFAGVSVSTIREYGLDWFNQTFDTQEDFNQKCLAQIQQHQQQNHCVVFVSGGFFATLEPLAKYLNVQYLLCVEPSGIDGVLTGSINLNTQTIGMGKAKAIRQFILDHVKHSELLQTSYAYGDHISDYEMLSIVGNPVVVGDDMEMVAIANKNGWKIFN